jgi:hypothetical protein
MNLFISQKAYFRAPRNPFSLMAVVVNLVRLVQRQTRNIRSADNSSRKNLYAVRELLDARNTKLERKWRVWLRNDQWKKYVEIKDKWGPHGATHAEFVELLIQFEKGNLLHRSTSSTSSLAWVQNVFIRSADILTLRLQSQLPRLIAILRTQYLQWGTVG